MIQFHWKFFYRIHTYESCSRITNHSDKNNNHLQLKLSKLDQHVTYPGLLVSNKAHCINRRAPTFKFIFPIPECGFRYNYHMGAIYITIMFHVPASKFLLFSGLSCFITIKIFFILQWSSNNN